MAIEKVRKYFKEYNLEDRIIEFNDTSKTVKDAAERLNCKEGEIAKTMAFKLKDKCIVILLAGDKKIDNAKYKQEFLEKAKMIEIENLNELIGHEIGGVCPFAIKNNVDVYLDESLKEYEIVYPAAGSDNSAVKLSIKELEKYSNYKKWINVSK